VQLSPGLKNSWERLEKGRLFGLKLKWSVPVLTVPYIELLIRAPLARILSLMDVVGLYI
jgi:hypothetical protein